MRPCSGITPKQGKRNLREGGSQVRRLVLVAMILGSTANFIAHSAWASVPYPPYCTVAWECLKCNGTRVMVCPKGDASGIRVLLRDEFYQPVVGALVTASFDADCDTCLYLSEPVEDMTDVNGEAYLRICAGLDLEFPPESHHRACLQVVTTVKSMALTLYRDTTEWFSPDMTQRPRSDFHVDMLDYAVWALDYLTSACRSDFDCDGIVDCRGDINIFATHWMHSSFLDGGGCPVWPAFTGTYFKIPNSHPNTGIGVDGCVVAGLVESTLGPNGLPVVSPSGASYRGPSGPITDVNAFGEILWWSTTSPHGVLYEKTQAETLFPLSFSGFFPDGQGSDCDYYRAVHWQGIFLSCDETLRFTLASDDDAWAFIDSVLKLDNGGVSQGKCVSTDVTLSASWHTFDLFYIDRHRSGAAVKFSSDLWPDAYPCSVNTGDVACTPTACSDGTDNDGDGCRDYPADLGCSSPSDDSEVDAGCAACSDGIDNDLDGYTDYPADPGCACPQDNSEVDVTSVGELPPEAYLSLRIYQSYPNPFNPLCTIRYEIPKPGRVRLQVFDIVGKPVRTLVDSWREIGVYSEVWDGRDDVGKELPSGVYFYRLEAGDFAATRKMVLLR